MRRLNLRSYRGRIPALDGLRGFAALVVVFHHSFIWPMLFAKGITTGDSFYRTYGHNIPLIGLCYGYSGVELFFLLSGFCLFFPVFSRPEKAFSLRTYAAHRFRRIYPPYLASLFFAVCLAAIAQSTINAHLHYATEPLSFRSVATSATLLESHYCLPYWSLVVEAQWYFVVPVLSLLWKRARWAIHGGMLGAIAMTAALAKAAPMLHLRFLNLGALVMFLPLFWIGIILAQIAAMDRDRQRILLRRGGALILLIAGAIAIFAFAPPPAVWAQSAAQAYPFGIFYAGLLAAALFTPVGKRLFSSKWIVAAGSFSYSLYLIHALVVYVAIVLLDHFHISGRAELVVCLTALPATCIGVGYLFYLLVEKRVQVNRTHPLGEIRSESYLDGRALKVRA